MKHIKKFIKHINESNVISEDEIKDFLVYISDMNVVEYKMGEIIATVGKNKGTKFTVIYFQYKFEKTLIIPNNEILLGDDFWNFIDHLIEVKDRTEKECYISLHDNGCTFYIPQDKVDDKTLLLKTTHDHLRNILNQSFSYSELLDNKIRIPWTSYDFTEKKLKYRLNKLDRKMGGEFYKKFNYEIIRGEVDEYGPIHDVVIEITLK